VNNLARLSTCWLLLLGNTHTQFPIHAANEVVQAMSGCVEEAWALTRRMIGPGKFCGKSCFLRNHAGRYFLLDEAWGVACLR
jgi:hypothetical protein